MISASKRLLRRILYQSLTKYYNSYRQFLDKAALFSFNTAIGNIRNSCQVSHPFYLKNPQYITIGENFCASPGLRLEAWDNYGCQAYLPSIIIGNNVVMNFNVHIGAISQVTIKDNVLIGSNVLITDHFHGTTSEEDMRLTPLMRPLVSKGPVVIESNVWIGEGVCILPGVQIGHNAIIGANAVVTHNIDAGSVVAGIPAKPLV